MDRFARIGAGWLATCLFGGFVGLIVALGAPVEDWWRTPLAVLAVVVMVVGVVGLTFEALTWQPLRQATASASSWRHGRKSSALLVDAVIAGPSFHFFPMAVNENPSQHEMAYMTVHNTAPTIEARNCRGRLIAITSMDAPRRQTLDVPLAWAQPDIPNDPSRKSFYGSARLNVAVHATPNYMTPAAAHPLDSVDHWRAQIQRDADNLIGVEVSADGIPAVVGWFRLKWWTSVRINSDSEGVTDYLLRYAQMEFESASDD